MKLPSPSADWYVVRCRPRSEHLAAEELREGGFETYLPQRRLKNYITRNRLVVERHVPAMPGYVFLAAPAGSGIDWAHLGYDSAFRHVGRPLRGSCGPLRLPAKLINDILTDEMNGALDEVGAHDKLGKRFAVGSQLRIINGPFADARAFVQSVTGNDRIKALIKMFGRMTTVEFEPSQLEVA